MGKIFFKKEKKVKGIKKTDSSITKGTAITEHHACFGTLMTVS